jgi:ketosteroid isomerase-like protein
MSANLDLVRSIHADWERGDFRRTDWADPRIEFDVIGSVAAFEPTKGLAGMAQALRDFLCTWADYRAEADEYRGLDAERVLVLVHDSGRGRASGLDLESIKGERAILFCVRDGKVTRLVVYWDRDRAFADLGLGPEGETQ